MRRLLAVTLSAILGTACAGPSRVDFPPPSGDVPYSSATRIGHTLFIAGHLGIDPETGKVPADAAAEANLLLDRFAATMTRAEMTLDDLVQVQVFCSDVSLYDVWNTAYRARFTNGFPTRAFIGSGPLLRGARFEMQGIAVDTD